MQIYGFPMGFIMVSVDFAREIGWKSVAFCPRITSIPHNALGQEITSDTDQRRLVFMVAKIYQARKEQLRW